MMTDIKSTCNKSRNVGIYIHVPFCKSKCLYCDFCSCIPKDHGMMDGYTNALISDIKSSFGTLDTSDVTADTVYFGGGTPTLLDAGMLERILGALSDRFRISCDTEITAECNPKTVDREKLSQLRRVGINRLSIGMQSAIDSELKLMGRTHRACDIKKVVEDARCADFNNISVDLMYGIPGQTYESFDISLDTAIALDVEHISSYALKLEENTPFYRMREKLSFPDDDAVCDMYEHMCNVLHDKGYNRYEISNFSRSGYESRHNLKYWQYSDYFGFGAAAHSFVHGERIENTSDIDAYIRGDAIIRSREIIDRNEQMNEYVMLAMRLEHGVDMGEFSCVFGCDFMEKFGASFAKYSPEFLTLEGGRCAFTQKGFFVCNYILSDILSF